MPKSASTKKTTTKPKKKASRKTTSTKKPKKAEELEETSKFVPTFLVSKESPSLEEEKETKQEAQQEEVVEEDQTEEVESETTEVEGTEEPVGAEEQTGTEAEAAPAEESIIEEEKEDDSAANRFAAFMSSDTNNPGKPGQKIDPESLKTTAIKPEEESKKGFYTIVGVLFVLILLAFGYLMYTRSQENTAPTTIDTPQPTTPTGVVEQLENIAVLPGGEVATVYNILNAADLKTLDAELFEFAINGQQIVLYAESGRAYIFDNINNKVVGIGIIDSVEEFQQNNAVEVFDETQADDDSNTVKVIPNLVLSNGTSAPGLTLSLQQEIEGLGFKVTIQERNSARESNYRNTVIYLFTTDEEAIGVINELAEKLEVEVDSDYPDAEIPPDSDVDAVVIVGKDRT